MKIVFLSFYSGLVTRGVETYVHELANRLSDHNSVTVYQAGPALPNAHYQTRQLSFSQADFNRRVFRHLDSDTDILIPTNGRIQSVLAKLWCLAHPHSRLIISGQSGPGLDDRLNLWCFPNRFIALTTSQSRWAKSANPLASVSLIPNGVDLAKFNPHVKPAALKLPHPIILYVAALEPIKRHNLLIQAVAQTPASLLLIGQGSLTDQIQTQANNLLKNRFKIMHFPYDQMPGVFSASDLFVYPTAPYESFGIAILEALATGLPVVATDDPIRREIVGDAGWFADPQNPSVFAATIKLALSSKPRLAPTQQAANFSWDQIANAYSKLCASLIS
jgi:glycosyltransferase involved in cell wall biosynthesis